MASFPTSIVTTSNLPIATSTGNAMNNPSHAGQHNNANAEIIAIETALGTSPQGSYASVGVAISSLGTAIVTAQSTANTALTNAATAQTTANAAQATATAAQTTATAAVPKAAFTAAGDLIAGTGSGTYSKVAVGTNGYFLAAQSTATGGVLWTQTLPVANGGTGSTAAANGPIGVLVLNSSAQIPAVDGSLLTNHIAVGSFARQATVGGGTQVVGIGFTPKAFVFNTAVLNTGTGYQSSGVDDGSNHNCSYVQNSAAWAQSTTYSIYCYNNSTATYTGYVSAVTSTSFTITWTATGAQVTANVTVGYIAYAQELI